MSAIVPTTSSPGVEPAEHTESALPEPLAEVERWRVDYVLQAIEPLSTRWPWMTTQRTCVMLVSLQTQWLLNCERAPTAAFVRQSGDFRGKPIYARAGSEVTLQGQVVPASVFVQAVPATAIVPDSKQPDTAQGQGDPFVVVSSLDTLIGTHPSFPPNTTTEEWMSIFVHEFFHTRQLLVPAFAETYRAMTDRELDRERLITLYKTDPNYRALVQQEYLLLSEAARTPAPQDAHKVLRTWLALYETRRAYLLHQPDGPMLVRADSVFSYVEGVARYVENIFLIDPQYHPATASQDPHFQAFKAFENKGYEGMLNKGLGERYFYALGMYLALLLDAATPTWPAQVHAHPNLLLGLALHPAQHSTAAAHP